MLKLMSTDFLGRFWKIIIFVFLGLTFSIHVLQYEERVFKQFCNPVLDLDRMIDRMIKSFLFHLEEQMDQTACFRINTANCLYRG